MLTFDPLYWFIVGPCLLLSFLCSAWVKSSFSKWSQVGARNGMTGAQVAKAILDFNGIRDVSIEQVGGFLSDHYDPRSKTLRLSPQNYGGRSVAALGIAAHEVGHAVQHARAYAWLGFRSALVPLVGIGSNLAIPLIFLGMILHSVGLAQIGVVVFGLTTLFTLVTLPVEFDASKRAMVALADGRILVGEELDGARAVLRAAASTYVAAAISSLATLIYFALRTGLLGGRDD
ncbi:MAG: zinc metallopeptidase [Planctomycetes bacterium]|nr:zinc metallopeptidase [Planctomycetota bacterium]